VSVMAGRSVRGFSLQVPSFQLDEGVEYATRVVAHYKTESDQTFRVTFSEEAEVPITWPSPISGEEGVLLTAAGRRVPRVAVVTKHERTHMDMVRERRTEAELEDILEWRLGMLRAKRGGGPR
jgi:hypothetical protein